MNSPDRNPNPKSNKAAALILSAFLMLCALLQTGCLSSGGVLITPQSLSFGSVSLESTSDPQTVTLKNIGTSAITVRSITVSGANAGDFTISTNTCGAKLAASSTCAVSIVFAPTADGARTATLSITHSGFHSSQTIALSGTGTGIISTLTVNPTTLTFPAVNVGSTSAPQSTTLQSNGTTDISISGIAISSTNSSDFSISSQTCGPTLPGSASCTVSVVFTPGGSGARTATLTISDSASGSPHQVTLSGTGVVPVTGSVSVAPTSLTFASTNVGSTTSPQSVTVTNGSNIAITVTGIAISGTNSADFAVSNQTCSASLAPSATCTASITFTPSASGARTATLSISDSLSGSPHQIALSGTGATPVTGSVTVAPTSLTFASTTVGSTTSPQSVTVTNGSNIAITVTGVAISGTNSADFAISSQTCAAGLAASATCTVNITFTPSASGARTATLSISDSLSGSPHQIALSGTGTASNPGSVTASPTSLTFASTAVGSTTSPQSVTLSNGTAAAITISSVAISGTNPTDFSISSQTCAASLAASANCTVSIAFTPSASGTRTAALTFTDTASNSPQTVTLSGTGSSGSSTLSIEPQNPTVIVNQTLQFSASAGVTWTASCGTIDASGLFTAPAVGNICTVTATEIGNSTTASTQVTVRSSPTSGTLAIYPTSAAVFAGSTQIYQAQLSGVPDGNSLSYTVDGIADGNATIGTITNGGVYTAPAAAGKHTITVRDNSLGTTASATATIFSQVSVDFGSRAGTQVAVPQNIFGAERMDSMHNAADLDLVEAGGISYARFYALIPTVFATTTPNFASIDSVIQRITANGNVKVMLQMFQTPPWLQPNPNPCTAAPLNVLPKDFTAWGQMAAQYVKHMDATFPGVVTDYEIWNEPNTAALCDPTGSKLTDYMALYAAAAPLMRAQAKADGSSARVGGPATAGMQSAWVSAMVGDATISQNIDFISYHDYMFSGKQLGAQWDTYNGTISIYQKTQNTGSGPLATYLFASKLVAAGKQPQGKDLPIYNSEYNLDFAYAATCCQNDFTYSPVWNAMYIADDLNAVYNGAAHTLNHLVYFAANAHPYFCLIGEINTAMDCLYPLGSVPQPYPPYFPHQLYGSTKYLGLQNGGHMAQSISPPTLGNGLIVTAFYTTSLDAIVLINPSGETLSNVPVTAANTGLTSAQGTLYQIVNGQSIQSAPQSLQLQSGTSYTTTVTLAPYSVQAISIHN